MINQQQKHFPTVCDGPFSQQSLFIFPDLKVCCQLGFEVPTWHCSHHAYAHKPSYEIEHEQCTLVMNHVGNADNALATQGA